MERIGTPYKDYYFLDGNKVYNSLTKRYLRANNNLFTLVNEDNKRVKASLKALYLKVHGKVYCIDNIADLEGEQWKEIIGSGGNYFISNMGRIKSYKAYTAKILSFSNDGGYYRVNMDFTQGNKANYAIHRLVAEYFVKKPDIPMCNIVHHKDFNTLNNKANNLCWLTKVEHTKIHTLNNSNNKEQEENGTI